jgi:hypothetical protein
MFNPKAWSNSDLILEWIKHIYTPSTKYPLFPRYSTKRPPRFLSLDVFSGQKTEEVIHSFKALVNRSLKARIEELADQYIDQNEREWVEGKYSVSQRRVLLTKWVGQAWEDMHAEDGDMIRQAFVQVGLGLPIDGSRDHEIKIKDFPNVQVGNWRDWQPREAREGEDIQSNLTPEEVEALASSMLVDDDDDIVDSGETIIVDVE